MTYPLIFDISKKIKIDGGYCLPIRPHQCANFLKRIPVIYKDGGCGGSVG
jgi:hypothetical protein